MPQVELRQIEVFLALCEELHFGRTGQRTGMTPSRVSQTIRSLESIVDGRLFDRTSRTVSLTPLGAQLCRDIAPAYAGLQQAVAAARATGSALAGRLRLGIYTPIGGATRIFELVRAFEAEYPDCQVQVVDTGTGYLMDWLHERAVDLLVMRLPAGDPAVTVGPVLAVEPRVVAVAGNHELATRESVVLDELADYTFTETPLFPRELVDTFTPPRTPAGTLLRRRHVETATDAAIAVARGDTLHATVPSFVHNFRHNGIVGVPLVDLPPLASALVWLAGTEGPILRAFAAVAERMSPQPETETTVDDAADPR